MYNDLYETIDGSMSDTNVGGEKPRNIRDNLFVVYGIITYDLEEGIEIDMTLYDLAKCFDSMWFQETMNDLLDAGAQGWQMNTNCNIAVKTPAGITDKIQFEQI